jgi:hypothetical protein
VWVMVTDFPVITQDMTLAQALALPESLLRRYAVSGVAGNPTTIVLPPGSTGRFVRIWANQPGELTIPEVEIISQ